MNSRPNFIFPERLRFTTGVPGRWGSNFPFEKETYDQRPLDFCGNVPHRLSIQAFKLQSSHPNLSPPRCVLVMQSRLTLCKSQTVPLSMGFSRQEFWSGLPFPSPGDLPNPGIEPTSPEAPASEGGFFTTSTTWETPSSPITWSNSPQLRAPALPLVNPSPGWNPKPWPTFVPWLLLFLMNLRFLMSLCERNQWETNW